ncbi:MAG: hypothetical protein IJE89_01480 [Bacilli bacterium]|nr:hypothetical protein [Bacilli bacterium]
MENNEVDFLFETDNFYNAEKNIKKAINYLDKLNSSITSIHKKTHLLGSDSSSKSKKCKLEIKKIIENVDSLNANMVQLKEQLYDSDPTFAQVYDMMEIYGDDVDFSPVSSYEEPVFTTQYDYLWANLSEEEKSENMIKNCDAAIEKLEEENARLWNEWTRYFNGSYVAENYGLTYSFGDVLDTPEYLKEGNGDISNIWAFFDANEDYYVKLINDKYKEKYGEIYFNEDYTLDDFKATRDNFGWDIIFDSYIADYTKKYNRYMADKVHLDAENDERMKRINQIQQELASIRASKYSIQQYQKELPYLRIAETQEYKTFADAYRKQNSNFLFMGDVPEEMVIMQAYLLDTQGQDAVDAYNVAVEDKWNQIYAAREAKKYLDMVTGPDGKIDQNLLTGALTAGEGLWAGIVNFGEGLGNLFNEEGMISVNSYTQMYILEALTNTSGSYANELAANIYKTKGEEEYNTFVEKVGLKTGKLDLEYAKTALTDEEYKLLEEKYNFDKNNVLGHTYQISTSIGNMAPTMITSLVLSKVLGPAVGAKVGAVLGTDVGLKVTSAVAFAAPIIAGGGMAWSSAGNAYNQALVDGYDRTASYQYGICSGLSEATMTLLLSNIPGLNIIGDTGLFGEGAEEFIQTYVDAGFRYAILGESVDFESLSEEAKMSFWYGVITAGVMDGGVSLASNVYTELKTGGVNVSSYQDLVNYALISNNKSITVDTKVNGDSKQVVISIESSALESDTSLASKLHSLYPEAVLLRNNPNGTVSIIDPDFNYTINDVSKIFTDTKAIVRNPDGTISPISENIGLEGEVSTTEYINRKQEMNIQQATNYELYQKQVSLIRAELAKVDYGKASTSKYMVDYLASNLKKFFYTNTNSVSGLNQDIEQNGLYHFTTAADQIIKSGYIKSSDMMSSYGNPKTFFFNGVPSVGAFATNLDNVPLKTVAVKVTPTSESLESSKFKVRYMDDKAITYDGKFQLDGSKVEKCYFGLTLENGKLVYKQISEAAYNSYESTALGTVMSEYVNNADNVAAIKADYLSNLAKENKLSISDEGRLLKDGESLSVGLQFFGRKNTTVSDSEFNSKNHTIDPVHGLQVDISDMGSFYESKLKSGFFTQQQIDTILSNTNNKGYISPEAGNYYSSLFEDGEYDIYVKTVNSSDVSSIMSEGVRCLGTTTSGYGSTPTDISQVKLINTVNKVDGLYDLVNVLKSSFGISQGMNPIDGTLIIRVPKGVSIESIVYFNQDTNTYNINPEYVDSFSAVDENGIVSEPIFNEVGVEVLENSFVNETEKLSEITDPAVIEVGIKNGTITKGQVQQLFNNLVGDNLSSWVLDEEAATSLYINLLDASKNAEIQLSDVKECIEVLDSMSKYYEEARDGLKDKLESGKGFFNTYRTHGIVHAMDVLTQSINSYAAFKDVGIDNLSLKTIMLSAVMHDTGMSGGKEIYFVVNEQGKLEPWIKEDAKADGGIYRKSHSFNSGVDIILESEILRKAGYSDLEIAEAAILTFAHSKSNSGLKSLSSNEAGWSFAVHALSAATEDSDFDIVDVLLKNGVIKSKDTHLEDFAVPNPSGEGSKDQNVINKVGDNATGKAVGKIEVYDFNLDWITKAGYESLIVRIGDALTNNDNAGTNQYGKPITFKTTNYNVQLSFNELMSRNNIDTTLPINEQLAIMLERFGLKKDDPQKLSYLKLAEAEAANVTYEIDGDKTNKSPQFVLGENNQTYRIEAASENDVEVVVSIKNSEAVPFCTIFAIDERAGELISKGDLLLNKAVDGKTIKIVIELDTSTSDTVKSIYQQYADYAGIDVEIREVSKLAETTNLIDANQKKETAKTGVKNLNYTHSKYGLDYAEYTGIGTSGKGLRLSEIEPAAVAFLQEDSNTVFGYRIVGNERFAGFDFSNEAEVMKNREIRIKYLLEDNAIQEEVKKMKAEGYSVKEMAEYAVNTRNQNKVRARANMELAGRIKVAIGNVVTYGSTLGKDSKENVLSKKDDIYRSAIESFEYSGVVDPTDEMIYNRAIEIVSQMVGISYEKGLASAIGPDLEWCFRNKLNKLGPNVSEETVYLEIINGSSKANPELNAALGLKQ